MFKDREEALRKMEQELLEEEELLTEDVWEEEDDLWEEDDLEDIPDVYNTDRSDEDLEDYSGRLEEEPQKGILGLAFLAMGLMAGIFLLAVYWYFKLAG